MSAKAWKTLGLLIAAVSYAVVGAGCSSNPPCDVDLATVDSARSAAKAAEAKLEDVEAQKARLESQIQQEKARKAELENRKQELLDEIKELGG